MGLDVLLAVLVGFFVGRVVDNVVGGGKKLAEVEEGGADEAAGAVAAEAARPEPKAAKTGKKVAAKGTVVTLEAPPEKTGEPDLQQVILDVLSGTGDPDLQQAIMDVLSGSRKAMTLAGIARKIGKAHYASLIGPMRALLKMGRIVKEDKVYRMA